MIAVEANKTADILCIVNECYEPLENEHLCEYSITSYGRVFSHKKAKSKELKLHTGNSGYLKITIGKKGKSYNYMVHRLVARYFIGPCPEGHQVNHVDGNKLNNNAGNLKYVTQYENMRHARDLSLLNPVKGENHKFAKLTKNDVETIRCFWGMTKIEILVHLFKVDESTIRYLLRGDTWK